MDQGKRTPRWIIALMLAGAAFGTACEGKASLDADIEKSGEKDGGGSGRGDGGLDAEIDGEGNLGREGDGN